MTNEEFNGIYQDGFEMGVLETVQLMVFAFERMDEAALDDLLLGRLSAANMTGEEAYAILQEIKAQTEA